MSRSTDSTEDPSPPASGQEAPQALLDRLSWARGLLRAVGETLALALPSAAILALVEGLDGSLSDPGYIIGFSYRGLFVAAILAFYLTAALGLGVLEGLVVAGLRRWLLGASGWRDGRLVPWWLRWAGGRPLVSASLLAGSACFLLLAFTLGFVLFRFTIDAQFELPREAAAVLSAFHLVLALSGAGICGLVGYGLGRVALHFLRAGVALRVLAMLPLGVMVVLGYTLFTRVFTRILDLRWLGGAAFLGVWLGLQGLLALGFARGVEPGAAGRVPGQVARSRGLFLRLCRHRYARLLGLVVVVLAVILGFRGYAELNLVRFQFYRFAPFAPHLARGLLAPLDWDGDGHVPVLGGLDCDNRDPNRHPDAYDVPSDGVDGNCIAGDVKRDAVMQAWIRHRTVGAVPHTAVLPVPRKRYNVLLITIDAARADHMSFLGYRRATAPYLGRLAKRSLTFTHCRSQSNFTDLSLYSLLTGLYPSSFVKGRSLVAGRTLADYLAGMGYQTYAVNDLREGRQFFAQGFETFDNTLGIRNRGAIQNQTAVSSGADLTLLAARFLEQPKRDQPFFLWVHYSDPHGRYLKHKGFDFGDTDRDRYDSELAYTDRQLARLLGLAERRGLLASTVIVVGSDHGEAFGEHGAQTHGHTLYEEEIRVPLLVFVPDGKGGGFGRRIDAPVENVDILPTVLDLLGHDGQVTPLHGESLLGLAFGGQALRSPETFAEQRHQNTSLKALIVGKWKLVWDVGHSFFELYDLEADPRERRNLADERPQLLSTLKRRLFEFVDLYGNGFKTYPPPARRSP